MSSPTKTVDTKPALTQGGISGATKNRTAEASKVKFKMQMLAKIKSSSLMIDANYNSSDDKKSIMPTVAIQNSTEEFLERAITASSHDDSLKE